MLSHTCHHCGLNLTRVPAPLDSVYGLPVVVCPECRAATVRRSDGHRLVPREISRTINLTRHAAATLFLLPISLLFMLAAASLMAEAANEVRMPVWKMLPMIVGLGDPELRDAWMGSDGLLFFALGLVISLVVGAALLLLLPRGRRLILMPVFVVLVAAAIFVPTTVDSIIQLTDPGATVRGVLDETWQNRGFHRKLHLLSGLALVAAILPLGMLLSVPVSRSFDRMQALRRKRMRRRMRARRQSS